MQDGAPAHTSKKVMRWVTPWLANQGYSLLHPWPGNSPHLNIIENCWKQLKRRVSQLQPSSLTDLKQKFKQVWVLDITPEYCKTLSDSMPTRLQACN